MAADKNGKTIRDSCPECGGDIISNSFEYVCKYCGLIIGKYFKDSSFIFNKMNIDGNLSKQYVALGERTDFIGGLGSFIDYEKTKYLRDKSGRLLLPGEQKLFRRLKKNYAQFLRIKNHETEYRVINILNKISSYLNLNKNIRNNAAYYYKKIIKNEEKVINNISLIAFCIFFAARKEYHNAPITVNEISQAFQNFGHRVTPRLILRDGIHYKHHLNDASTPHKSEDYLIRLVDDVMNHRCLKERIEKKGVSFSVTEFKNELIVKCREILIKLPLWHRGGRNPFILTGGIIYLADKLLGKEHGHKSVLTQRIISEATGIAEYSIRDHYVNLLKPLFLKKMTLDN